MIGHQCANHVHHHLTQPHQSQPQPETYIPRPIDNNSIYNKLRSQGSTTSHQQLRQFQILIHQNTQLRLKVSRMQQKLQQAEDISNRLYHQIQSRDAQPVNNTSQFQLRNELSNAQLQIAFLEQQVSKYRKQQEHHANTVIKDYEDKNEEILDLKRKVCDLLDIKRRLQQQLDTYEFELTSMRDRYEVEIRERRLRNQALQRAVQDHNTTHRKELFMVQEKLRQKDKYIKQISMEMQSLRHQKIEGEKQCHQLKKKYQALEEIIKKKNETNLVRYASPRFYEDDLMRDFYSVSRSPIKQYANTPSTSVNSPKNNTVGVNSNKDILRTNERVQQMVYERVNMPKTDTERKPEKLPQKVQYRQLPINPLTSTPYNAPISTSQASRQLVEHMFNNFSRIVQRANSERCNALVLFSQEMPGFLRSVRPLAQNYFRLYLSDPIQQVNRADVQEVSLKQQY